MLILSGDIYCYSIFQNACLAFETWIIGNKRNGYIWIAIFKSNKSYLIQRQFNRYDANGPGFES